MRDFSSFLVVALVSSVSFQARAQEPPRANDVCSNLGIHVFIGGTAGFNTLADPSIDDTSTVRATGQVALYQHGNAVSAAISANVLPSIVKLFAGTGPGQAELGWVGANYFTLPASQYPGYYQAQYIAQGLRPTEANIDTPDKPEPATWRAYVDAARSVGIRTVAPIVAPNITSEPRVWSDAYYDIIRQDALYGGAIAFDTPSAFFLTGGSGPGYQAFIKDAIRWGNRNGLRTTVILSPYGSPRTFLKDTQEYVKVLASDPLTTPSEWSVDDYQIADPNANPYTDPNAGFYMGPDTLPNSTAGVGLWVVENAPVARTDSSGVTVSCLP